MDKADRIHISALREVIQIWKRAVAFILAKVMLNIDVFINETEFNDYKRTTDFDKFTVQRVALVHNKMKERNNYERQQSAITKQHLKDRAIFATYYIH